MMKRHRGLLWGCILAGALACQGSAVSGGGRRGDDGSRGEGPGAGTTPAAASGLNRALLRSSVEIQVPEVGARVRLGERIRLGEGEGLRGRYVRRLDPGVVERGSVVLEAGRIAILGHRGDEAAAPILFAVPFFISNQGTGLFAYVGLFAYDVSTGEIRHLDSRFLGDRVRRIELVGGPGRVRVSFLRHAPGQSMADEPVERKVILIGVDRRRGRFRPSVPSPRMHPSWDRDRDGLNDCEKDGSCDHTVDYSRPRED